MIERRSAYDDDDEMDATHWEFDIDDEDPEIPIAEVVARLEGTDPTALRPLNGAIDGLVNDLFSDPPPAATQARVEFTYEGYRILVHQDGHATVMAVE